MKLGVKGTRPLGPSGGAMLIDRELFEGLGGFNEEFFMWAEDSEFGMRLQRVGQETNTLDLKLDHSGGHSLTTAVEMRQKAFLLARNRLYAMRMHLTFPLFVIQIPLHLLAALTLTIGVKLADRTAVPYLRGLAVGLFGKLPVGPNVSSRKLGLAWRLFNLKRS
jgi:GT2 family glycosyltransferase